MKKYRKFIWMLGLIGILALIYFPVRNYYHYLKEPVAPLTDAIPVESAIIIKTLSLNKLIAILQSSEIFGILELNKSKYGIKSLVEKIDLIRGKSSIFNDIIENSESMICMVPGKEQQPEFLFLASIGKTDPGDIVDELDEILPVNSKTERIKNSPSDLFRISDGKNEIWFYVYRGVLAFAYNREVLELSCKTAGQKKNLMDQHAFARLTESSGKKVDGILMLNNKKLVEAFLHIKNQNPLQFKGSPFDGWTSLDLHIEKDRVMMDGFMAAQSDTTIFTGQKPGNIDYLRYFPANTAFAATLTISNQELYCSGFFNTDTLQLSGYDSANQTSSMEIFRCEEHIRSWIGNSVSFVATPSYFSGNEAEHMIMVGIKSKDSAVLLLKPYMKPFEGDIKTFTASNFAQNLWGGFFATGQNQFCLITDQMLVISPSSDLLKKYLNDLNDNLLLGSTGLYEKAITYLLDECSVCVYMIPEYCKKFRSQPPSKELNSVKFSTWSGVPASTGLLCIQLSAAEPLLFTHAFALFDPKIKDLALKIDTSGFRDIQPVDTLQISKNPQTAQQTPSNQKITTKAGIGKLITLYGNNPTDNFVLSANKNTITAYQKNGKILWSFTCKGEPGDRVYEIKMNGVKGSRYLIATETHLHIIDQNGKESKNSPVKVPSGIKGNIALFDYDKRNDYRILYAGKDNRIHNITLNNEELSDWLKPEVKNRLNTLQFFRTSGKDFIVFSDNSGKVNVIDRRGKPRIKVDDKFTKSTGSAIFENKTNSKGLFLMASESGSLAYLDGNGMVTESEFGEHGKNPWFDYLDFNGDGRNEFVFCGNGKVAVYNKMKDVIASASLKNANFSKPFIYASQKENWLAVRDTKSGRVMVLNNKNQALKAGGIHSETDPLIIKTEDEKRPVLVTTENGQIIFTPIE